MCKLLIILRLLPGITLILGFLFVLLSDWDCIWHSLIVEPMRLRKARKNIMGDD